MLKIQVLLEDKYDEETNSFIMEYESLELEHSLVSLSKWEAEHEIPFLVDTPKKTPEQTMSYIKHMTLGEERSDDIYTRLTQKNVDEITAYIDRKMTATWFTENPSMRTAKSSEVITAELIYYWMVALQIPFECQYWHLKRLLTLIQVCSLKNQPAKKMSKREVMAQQTSLNAARKAQLGSNG